MDHDQQHHARLVKPGVWGAVLPGLILGIGLLELFAVAALAENSVAEGHDYVVQTWQVEDGLPQNSVISVAQSQDGYLWAATQDGLACFDGARFVVFNPQNLPAIHNSRIVAVFGDRQGVFWVGTEGAGLVRMEHGQNTAYTFPNQGTSYNYVHSLCDDDQGGVWIASNEGELVHWQDGSFTVPSRDWKLAGTQVSSVAGDRSGQVWVGTDKELAVCRNGTIEPVWGQAQQPGFRVEYVATSRSGGCWVLANGRLRKFQDGKWTADLGPYAWTNRSVYGLYEDHLGQVWVATMGDGLFRYRANGAVLRLTTSDGLPTDLIRCVTEDREGNIWVGTEGGGLCRLKPAIFQVYGRRDGLSSDQILSVCEDDAGAIWIGTDGDGLNRIQSGQVERFGLAQGVENGHIWSVLCDHHGTVWAGTWGGLFREENGQFTNVSDFVTLGASVTALFQDSKAMLWIGQQGLGGLACWRDNKLVSVKLPEATVSQDVRTLVEDAAGALWIGTQGNGLYRLKNGEFTHYGLAEGLGSETIWSLLPENNGTVWIGTAHGGLSRWRDGKIATCTEKNGLVNDVICQILDDHQGHLWFGSHEGVFRADKNELNMFADGVIQTVHCLSFVKTDGLPSVECSGGFEPSGLRSRDGRLWFPTVKGLAVLNPANIKLNPLPPPVIIEAMLVDNVAQPLTGSNAEPNDSSASFTNHPPNKAAPLRIDPGKHQYDFYYTALSLTAPGKVHFKYQLEGLDDKWLEAGTRRSAHYSFIPSGEYRFRVIACNNDGIWNVAGDTLTFTILPYFWQTVWFRLSAAGLLLVLTVVVAQQVSTRRLHIKLRRIEQERALERERSRIARDIHDDLGARLTKISMLTAQARSQSPPEHPPSTQLSDIDLTAREMVEAIDATVWAVNPRNDTLNHLADYLVHHVEEFLRHSEVHCRLNLPTDLPDWPVSAELRHNVFLVVKEALNNVVKHAAATEVWFDLEINGQTLRITIRDNGHGFNPDGLHKRGNGLHNMTQRLKHCGGHLSLKSALNTGTSITLELNLRTADDRKET